MARQSDGSAFVLPLGLVALGFALLDRIVPPSPDDVEPGEGSAGDPLEVEPTLSFERMQQLADTIDQALLQNPWMENEQAAIDSILECRNDADVAGLIAVFGVRHQSPAWWFPGFTLPGAVAEYLDPDEKEELNAGLIARGISFTFH